MTADLNPDTISKKSCGVHAAPSSGAVLEPLQLLVVARDQALVKRLILACAIDGRLQITGWASGEDEFRQMANHRAFDVALIDFDLPLLAGIAAMRRIAISEPAAQVLVVLSPKNIPKVMGAVLADADAYLLKDQNTPENMIDALIGLSAGACSISPQIARFLVECYQHTH